MKTSRFLMAVVDAYSGHLAKRDAAVLVQAVAGLADEDCGRVGMVKEGEGFSKMPERLLSSLS